jgi:hypothetical protein
LFAYLLWYLFTNKFNFVIVFISIVLTAFIDKIFIFNFFKGGPIGFQIDYDKISFFFRDEKYARDFSLMNKGNLFEDRLLKDFGKTKR